MMKIKNLTGDVLFALETAKTLFELVTAAVQAKKNLRGADLRGADLTGADLTGAYLRGAYLGSASLRHAVLRGADLRGADLRGADLRGADLTGADLGYADLTGAGIGSALFGGKKIHDARVFSGLYRYEIWAVMFEDSTRWVRMGCFFKSLDEWEQVGIRKSNPSEFPDDGSEKCEERVAAFEFAKAAVLCMKTPVAEVKNGKAKA